MPSLEGLDRVVELTDAPQMCPGAPCPIIMATDFSLMLLYWLRDRRDGEDQCLVTFDQPLAHHSGPPNDEALHGHYLHARGLGYYGAFEVRQSSWVRALERMNRVHSKHRPDLYDDDRHFVFTFHDSTFECVAMGLSFERLAGNPTDLLARTMQQR